MSYGVSPSTEAIDIRAEGGSDAADSTLSGNIAEQTTEYTQVGVVIQRNARTLSLYRIRLAPQDAGTTVMRKMQQLHLQHIPCPMWLSGVFLLIHQTVVSVAQLETVRPQQRAREPELIVIRAISRMGHPDSQQKP